MLLTVESPKLYFTGNIDLDVDSPLAIQHGITSLVGDNGSGKSLFTRILQSGWNYRTNIIKSPDGRKPKIVRLEFSDVHSWVGNSIEYYQQRYEAAMNDEVPTVGEIVGEYSSMPKFVELCDNFGLSGVRDKKINFLSSGELRKLLIINSLSETPDLLILDNPYIGLDKRSREALNEALIRLRDSGVSVMLVLSDPADVPHFTDNRLFADRKRISQRQPSENRNRTIADSNPYMSTPESYEGEVLNMRECNVHYGKIKVLDKIDWQIHSGEKWCLSGPNGSGKSTLLSLVYADNPKCYNNDISLFGKRRGTGESIWDIKRRIGYVSPEMRLHFHGNGTVRQIIAAGINDTVGLFVKPTEKQLEKADKWLRHFDISYLSSQTFRTLSSGERQLVLVVRAMIKEPELLILDEPMHALDSHNKKKVEKAISDFFIARPHAAFIMVTHYPEELPESITHHFNLSNNHATREDNSK